MAIISGFEVIITKPELSHAICLFAPDDKSFVQLTSDTIDRMLSQLVDHYRNRGILSAGSE